jgi:diphthamide biosynthesis enzyme Dph1/Dph2-like protein
MKLDKIYNMKGEVTGNITKTLMKRLGLIEKLKKLDRFGVLVSNASTQFCQSSIKMCRELLKSKGKACYLFMMSISLLIKTISMK